MKTLLITYLLIGISFLSSAQNENSSDYEGKYAIGISGGSTGGGIDVSKNVHAHFNVKLAFNYFKLSDFSQTLSVKGESMNSTVTIDFTNVEMNIEYLPFKGSSFKIVGGLAYLLGNSVQAIGKYTENVTFGEMTLTPNDIGNLELKTEWSQIAPYFGLGFGRGVPKRRVGFGLDIGAYYLGSPKVTLKGTHLLEEMKSQQVTIESNMSDYSWFPRFTLRLAVRLN